MKQTIYLAGGCFWGVDAYFKQLEGVEKTQAGYANGLTEDTFYENLKNSDHAETVKVTYEDEEISLEKLLEYFYYIIDPFSINKQGGDLGRQYRTGIYSEDRKILEEVRKFLEEKQKNEEEKIQVEVEKLKNYIKAEEYHQDYLKKNPNGYCHVNLLDRPDFN
ncbi:Peptide methionine sulfoxide reductase msrA/msrB [Anaerococcus prevotii]|uniref:Peptide methionine sulfoxide reductase MsrA n=1 Tax=Anaerococcus prevotii (strain ATCC 9321 / DSM 20548 / JCM 6508 / NCTC 11806 / PC1) TaxID=525919 RepID=C7RGJ1_ANAPD|nr:peptide-methionine (S)-S-oxide reductase MsrA [Anaerococcus prevotii]ACV28602.1 peptide methionine sulfoxide reductase [Anaerococcus prevotii DSM 20548]SUU94161.1 Peptide methionine sulfoxide reductase msrA/msrB [Anaerococcus prevotii]